MIYVALLALAAPSDDDLMARWTSCLTEKGSVFARTAEPSDIAADAIMGACKGEEVEYLSRAYHTPTLERFVVGPRSADPQFVAAKDAEHARLVAAVRQHVLSEVVALRAKLTD